MAQYPELPHSCLDLQTFSCPLHLLQNENFSAEPFKLRSWKISRMESVSVKPLSSVTSGPAQSHRVPTWKEQMPVHPAGSCGAGLEAAIVKTVRLEGSWPFPVLA